MQLETNKLVQKFVKLTLKGKQKRLSRQLIQSTVLQLPPCANPSLNSLGKEKVTLYENRHFKLRRIFILEECIAIFIAFLTYIYYDSSAKYFTRLPQSACLVNQNDYTREMLRPVVKCDFCSNLTEVTVSENMTASLFLNMYAYSKVPALIKGETKNWTAIDKFDFKFFKDLFSNTEIALRAEFYQCQFQPYKSEFNSLEETFNMPEERALGKDGSNPWYIGWSNCHPALRKELRKHYQRPSFLPSAIESSVADCVFMGTPGQGAATHVDYIQRPSWQAQVSGRKTWTLIPPPECESVCRVLHVTVNKGDILTVDTNLWYHSTAVEPGEISIAIGSEYS